MRKMLFIYNPRAGKGEIRNRLSHILEEFSRHDMQIEVHPTRKAGDATQAAREKGADYDLLVCSGGDGTLDEVVTGIMEAGLSVPVGYIPAGSTNDFASSLGIPKQMKKAASDIANGEVFPCDVGQLNDQYFVYVAAFGVFTEVSYQTSQDMKNMLGHLAYMLEGVKSLSTVKSWKLKFTSEEMSGEGEFLYGMITNSNSVGGFKGITGPDVTLNDGLFEVTLIRNPENIIDWPLIINSVVRGESNDKVLIFKTSHIEFESEEEIPWTTDGEYGGTYHRAVIENKKQALNILLAPTDASSSLLPDEDDQELDDE